jgi:hypothetical protein
MGAIADARRRQLARRGRPMTLSRLVTDGAPVAVTPTGYARDYRPEELVGGIMQGDIRVEIGADEIAAAAWPAPPRKPDRLVVDGRTYTVQGATAVYDGPTLAGWSLWARGGA